MESFGKIANIEELFEPRKKSIQLGNSELKIRSLSFKELKEVVNAWATGKPLEGMTLTLKYGIVSPKFIKTNIEKIDGKTAQLLSEEILKLTGLSIKEPPFNPSRR